MNAYELADELDKINDIPIETIINMLRQQADRIAELENQLDKYSHYEAMTHQEYMQQIMQLEKEKIRAYDNGFEDGQKANTQSIAQLHPLSDDELNKAFDYYCETDEGVLRFNYELRDEWKKEQLIRWKEAFKKARNEATLRG